MKKGMSTLGLALALVAAGCGVDERQGLVQTTVDMAGQTANRLDSITKSIEEAMKKADKSINLEDAEKHTVELGKLGKQLQENYQRIQVLKEGLTEEEKAKFQEEFQSSLTQSILRGSKQHLALHETMEKLKALAKENRTYEKSVDSLKAKLTEAQGQFETLARLR